MRNAKYESRIEDRRDRCFCDYEIAIWQTMKEDLESRTKRYALSVIALMSRLPKNKATDVIGYQLLRSGTSIGANYREASRGLSRDDFIYKIGICEKEAAETQYWLELLVESGLA